MSNIKRYLEDLNEYKKTLSEIKKEIEWILATTDDDVIVARCSSILNLIEKSFVGESNE